MRYITIYYTISLVLFFSMTATSCKKGAVSGLASKLEYTFSLKDAYLNFEAISVTNNSIGYNNYEWYIDNILISKSLLISNDEFLKFEKNKKHELKLAGTNEFGKVDYFIDSFIYRDIAEFTEARFFNFRSTFFNSNDTNFNRPAIQLIDDKISFVPSFAQHNPPKENTLISHVWTKDSFISNQNYFRKCRSRDLLFFIPTNKKNHFSTIEKYSIHVYFANKILTTYYKGKININNFRYDRANNKFIINTPEIDIELR